jgi:hypothetical protein
MNLLLISRLKEREGTTKRLVVKVKDSSENRGAPPPPFVEL